MRASRAFLASLGGLLLAGAALAQVAVRITAVSDAPPVTEFHVFGLFQ